LCLNSKLSEQCKIKPEFKIIFAPIYVLVLKDRIIFFGWWYLILMVTYAMCRFLFYFYNSSDFDNTIDLSTIFLHGMRFDFSTVAMVNGIFCLLFILPLGKFSISEIYLKVLVGLMVAVNGFFVALNMVDVVYFPFVQKRLQSDALLFINGEKGNEAFGMIPAFAVQYWQIWLLLCICLVVLFRLVKLLYNKYLKHTVVEFSWVNVLFLLGIAAVHIYGIRGGTQLRPIGVLDASNVGGVKNSPFILNSGFSLLRTWSNKSIADVRYFPDSALSGCFSPVKPSNPTENTSDFHKNNVVVILVESLSRQYMPYFGGPGYMPFLDSLMSQSLVFGNGYANARESVQGVPAALASIPAWMDEPFIFSRYASNKVASIADVLKKDGYTSLFFHGATTGSMGFHSFTTATGFDRYIGREDYNNEAHFDGSWGIWDHYFLPFMVDELSKVKQPFFASTLTLNSHHPFLLPKEYTVAKNYKTIPILNSFQYVDQALSDFFKKAATTDWYEHTIFVITADHTGPDISKAKRPDDDYRIPIIFFKPDGSLCGNSDQIANHIDIMPTIMDLLGIEGQLFTLGTSMLDESCEKYVVNYRMGMYQYSDQDYFMYFDGQKAIALYDRNDDKYFKNNLIHIVKYDNIIESAEEKIKKSIQAFNQSLLQNKMTPNAYR